MTRQETLGQIEQAFGFVPDYMAEAPDPILEQWWSLLAWTMTDTKLSARDKLLVSFGASAAIHCEYGVAHYTAQFALLGMDDDQVKEASWAAQTVTGLSSYLYGIGLDLEQFKQDLAAIGEHVRKAAQT